MFSQILKVRMKAGDKKLFFRRFHSNKVQMIIESLSIIFVCLIPDKCIILYQNDILKKNIKLN